MRFLGTWTRSSVSVVSAKLIAHASPTSRERVRMIEVSSIGVRNKGHDKER